MTELYKVPAQAVMSRIMTARDGKIVPGGGKHILIASAPKSASTYLCAIIAGLPQLKEVVLTVGHHRREQELCPLNCAIFHELNYVAAHHTRYSQPTQELLTRYSIFPVVLVRNIFDCVISMRDHLLSESLDIPQAYVPRNFHGLTVQQQYDFIIDFVVPWYASFVASWSEYEGPGLAYAYRKLVRDFPAAVQEILTATGIQASRGDIDAAIAEVKPTEKRFNVGRVGRGMENLSDEQMGRIRRHFAHYQDIPGIGDVLGYDSPEGFMRREHKEAAPARALR